MSVDDFDPDPRIPGYVYERLADNLAARIAAGEFPVGARLPNQRSLAEEYGTSLPTVVRALEVLRERGLIETYRYKGSYVSGPPAAGGVAGER